MAYVQLFSIADITGDGANHAVQTNGQARWVTFTALAGNTGVTRIGDAGVSATEGAPLAPTATAASTLHFPVLPVDSSDGVARFYDLSQITYRVPNGDKLSIIWCNG